MSNCVKISPKNTLFDFKKLVLNLNVKILWKKDEKDTN